METNWLWDTRIPKDEVRRILRDEENPRFPHYAEKLLARTADPVVIFKWIDEQTFCRKWPTIKKRLQKDRWIAARVLFWQTIYERLLVRFKENGIKIRRPSQEQISPERRQLAAQIRRLRERIGFSQKDVARRLGVIQQYVSKLESGRENVSVDTLKRVAGAFGCRLVIKLTRSP
jgi:DNA-binding transcriptional regulator YiaG